jgi:hypothetical protein
MERGTGRMCGEGRGMDIGREGHDERWFNATTSNVSHLVRRLQ